MVEEKPIISYSHHPLLLYICGFRSSINAESVDLRSIVNVSNVNMHLSIKFYEVKCSFGASIVSFW